MRNWIAVAITSSLIMGCAVEGEDPLSSPPGETDAQPSGEAASDALQIRFRPGIASDMIIKASQIEQAPRMLETYDDILVKIEMEVPGYGGHFFDPESGKLLIRLKDPTLLPRAEALIARLLGDGHVSDKGSMAIPTEYTFAELKSVERYLSPAILPLPGMVSSDVNENTNRVTFGAHGAEARARVMQRLQELNAPLHMIDIVEKEPVVPEGSLRAEWRPLAGGIQIQSPAGYCTLGLSAKKGTTNGFITCSHCTATQGGSENTDFAQPTTGKTGGIEKGDPTYWSGGACPANRVCRYSDSAWIQADSGVGINYYYAKTAGANDLEVTGWWNAVGKIDAPASGTALSKTGRTTGMTSGSVTTTCATINQSGSSRTILCSYQASYASSGGDSGSPVYNVSGSNAKIVGVHWGGGGTFSAIGNVNTELGTVAYCQSGC